MNFLASFFRIPFHYYFYNALTVIISFRGPFFFFFFTRKSQIYNQQLDFSLSLCFFFFFFFLL